MYKRALFRFFACIADLEDELIRAAGVTSLSRLIELEGDAPSTRGTAAQWISNFRRFIRSVSQRNSRYVQAIVETIDLSRLPRPLRLLLDYVEPGRT